MPTTLPESLAEKIIAEKIHEWEVSKATARKARDRETLELHPFLALTRDFGCGEEKLIPLFENRATRSLESTAAMAAIAPALAGLETGMVTWGRALSLPAAANISVPAASARRPAV